MPIPTKLNLISSASQHLGYTQMCALLNGQNPQELFACREAWLPVVKFIFLPRDGKELMDMCQLRNDDGSVFDSGEQHGSTFARSGKFEASADDAEADDWIVQDASFAGKA